MLTRRGRAILRLIRSVHCSRLGRNGRTLFFDTAPSKVRRQTRCEDELDLIGCMPARLHGVHRGGDVLYTRAPNAVTHSSNRDYSSEAAVFRLARDTAVLLCVSDDGVRFI